jgi:branched-chain amino acid transport system substrate-binding protein
MFLAMNLLSFSPPRLRLRPAQSDRASGRGAQSRATRTIAVVAGLAALAACATPAGTPERPAASTGTGGTTTPSLPADFRVAANAQVTPGHLAGRQVVRIAILAPFSSPNAGVREEAQTLQASAELALFEHGDGSVILMPKDSGDTPEEASAAARLALQNGADFILGPMFASGAIAVAPYARANRVPMFSFSADTTEAGRGVYVLTFLPEDEANRVIAYAAGRGVRRLVLIVPQDRFGERYESAARAAAAQSGVTVAGVTRYDAQRSAASLANAARQASALAAGGDRYATGIFMPDRGSTVRVLAQTLSTTGASVSRVRYLGTGLWNDPATLQDSRLLGGWFVTPDLRTRTSYEDRFQDSFGRRPTRLAGMAYDATALLVRMARGGNKSPVTPSAIEADGGFFGVDGAFRFRNGVIQRSLAVNEVGPAGIRVIEPSTGFGGTPVAARPSGTVSAR